MGKKGLRTIISLEVISGIIMCIGFMMLMEGCNPTKSIAHSHTETVESDTTYYEKQFIFPFKGESSYVTGDSVRIIYRDVIKHVVQKSVEYRDTVIMKDSIIYMPVERKVINPQIQVDHDTIVSNGEYGKASAWVANNILYLDMVVYDRVVTAKIDSAVQVVNSTKTIKDDTVIVKRARFIDKLLWVLIGMLILSIIFVVVYIVNKVKPKWWPW